MDLSIYLARVIGLCLVVMALALLRNPRRAHDIVEDLINSPAHVFLAGLFPLLLGSLMIVSHNLWVWDWRVVITIFGWLMFISGLFRLLATEYFVKVAKFYVQSNFAIYASFLTLVLGAFLLYKGFF
jgi:hypothetical protein